MYKKILSIALVLIFGACTAPQRTQRVVSTTLKGVGSSFVLPFSHTLFRDYEKHSTVKIDYTTTNSYVGMEELFEGEVDFALSSIFLTDEQVQQHPDILHIPVAAAGINFAYNVPGADFALNGDPIYITPEIFAKILNQKITNWNDPEILAVNMQVAENKRRVFPDLPITFIQRSEPSGDTYVMTTFLDKATPLWTGGKTNKLPLKDGFKEAGSSLDMMRILVDTPGALTYTTMIYGLQNNIPLLRIRNYLGTYGRGCNFRSTEAMKHTETNADNRVDLTYTTEGQEAGVATAMIYMLIRQDQNYNNRTKEQAQSLVNMIGWLLSPAAQRQLDPLFFALLTPKFRHSANVMLSNVTYDGQHIYPVLQN